MPRLSDPRFQPDCAIVVDGHRVPARTGESVTSALLAAGRTLIGRSAKYHRPRGPFCLAASCASCMVRVDGTPNVRACETPCREGLRVETQNAVGGAAHDLLGVIEEANRQGRPTLAISNNAESPMAQLATRSLELGVGKEEAVAATKTYTGQLMAIALVSAAIAGEDQEEQFRGLPPDVNEVLAAGEQIRKVALDFASHDRCVVIGRGFHHATAHEWALKIAELSYLVAQPFSSVDFRHGPIALIEPGLAVMAVASQGPLFAELSELLDEVTSAGAKVVAISDRDDLSAEYLLRIPTTPEWLSPIPAIVAAQVFTYHLTVARGNDPDRPRGLRKVTRTV